MSDDVIFATATANYFNYYQHAAAGKRPGGSNVAAALSNKQHGSPLFAPLVINTRKGREREKKEEVYVSFFGSDPQ